MHQHHHHHHDVEKGPITVYTDMFIGLADGLIITFALVAALYRACVANNDIFSIGLVAAAVGAVAFAIARFYATKPADHDHHDHLDLPHDEHKAVKEGVDADRAKWNEIITEFELESANRNVGKERISAAVSAAAYFVAAMVAVVPYKFGTNAFLYSIYISVFCLLAIGFFKGRYLNTGGILGALRVGVLGGAAAACAYFVAGIFS